LSDDAKLCQLQVMLLAGPLGRLLYRQLSLFKTLCWLVFFMARVAIESPIDMGRYIASALPATVKKKP